jgi:hypothetical protein
MLNAPPSASGVILFLELPPLSAERYGGDIVTQSADKIAYLR